VSGRNIVTGIDGIHRSEASEAALNSLFAAIFAGAAGEQALAYLRSITTNLVNGPGVTDGVLRHLEGQRFLTGIIAARVEHGRRKPADGTAAGGARPAGSHPRKILGRRQPPAG
jgi:hypothetical protein